ncbi:M949_RS01915 family surface polysaccharide biosynthesis protein [Luteimonas abyssi]|uniref:M949_RS01915 family surface polysaccharide biosynthesis protein n=1 Tax=Luteimonas abyssi TaxID=1247514 RepID=UPI0012F90E8A|nr:hypothetical protein [Luteimonas abyssi]
MLLLTGCHASPVDDVTKPAVEAPSGSADIAAFNADQTAPKVTIREGMRMPAIDGPRAPDLPDAGVEGIFGYRDAAGDHALLLRRAFRASKSDQDDIEHIVLSTHLYEVDQAHDARTGARTSVTWHIEDAFECEGLDFDADFLPDALRVEDLDGDGRAEVLFGYSSFCGGGIEPREITLILRAGEHEYRLQGESLVKPPGDAPAFGGTYATTPAEVDIPAPLRTALLDAWERVKHQSIE